MKARTLQTCAWLFTLALVLAQLSSCHRVSSEQSEVNLKTQSINVDLVFDLQKRINPSFPGRGITDYPGNTVEDVPKSYAMVLLGEIARKKNTDTNYFSNLEATAGQWLIEHSDENRDGVIGWGVPVAWDAYGDGSVNPAHTEYSISTAIVIDALLTWRQVVAGPKAKEILTLVEKAALPYLDSKLWTPAGMLPYSLRSSDRKYDTFNSAMYLAGQFQRLSTLTDDKRLAKKLRSAADSTVEAHLTQKKTSPKTGAWYWHYSITEEIPNDLPHAAYIVQGLMDYKAYGGLYAEKIDSHALLMHLEEFLHVTKELNQIKPSVRAWPSFRKDVNVPARSYDIGMALHLACSNSKLSRLKGHLIDSVSGYRSEQGQYLKYPLGSDQPKLVVAEYESYLYRGLSSCLASNVTLSNNHQRPVVFHGLDRSENDSARSYSTPHTDSLPAREVAFVKLTDSASGPRVFFTQTTQQTRLEYKDGRSVKLAPTLLPIALIGTDTKETLVLRSLSDSRLWLKKRNSGTLTEVRHEPDRYPIFRAAQYFAGHLHLVYYDNPTSANWLVQFEDTALGWRRVDDPVRLPSLQDPAGATYEMIPRMEFVHFGEKLWITGGTLSAEVQVGGIAGVHRFVDCVRAIEVVGTPSGPIALCNSVSGTPAPWVLSKNDLSTPINKGDAIPWNLRLSANGVQVDWASGSTNLGNLLARDLSRTQHSGWMEFGIDNDEGRIPWSQIYYLNGFMDILKLAKLNDEAARLFNPVIPLIKQRLDLEMVLLDQRWQTKKFLTKAFTVDRSPTLFAVQSSRLLLLFDRYQKEIPDALPLSSYSDIRSSVTSLRLHIEKMAFADQGSPWMERGQPYLMWPRGSKFYFDGLNVPFNHQNEWAYSVVRTSALKTKRLRDAEAILRFFSQEISPSGALPSTGEWNYWWGQAYDGWSESQTISANKPAYEGDKIKAWISFRTIDVMSLLATYGSKVSVNEEQMIESAVNLIQEGKIYPFAAYELLRLDMLVLPNTSIAHKYARVSSPWELQSAVWALLRLTVTQ